MKKRNNKAFTLVELIIVIAVIGVLAAILIPIFSNVVFKGEQKSAYQDAKNFITRLHTDLVTGDNIPALDTLFFVKKGGRIYLFGYIEAEGKLLEYHGASFPYGTDIATCAQDIVNGLGTSEVEPDAGVVVQDELDRAGDILEITGMNYDKLVTAMDFNPAELTILWGYKINAAFGA